MAKKVKQESNKVREIEKLLPKVLDKIFPAPFETIAWGWGVLARSKRDGSETEYIQCRQFARKRDIVEHFLQEPRLMRIDDREVEIGELFFNFTGEDFCSDSDRVKAFYACAVRPRDQEQIRDKLIPRLNDYGIEYIIHYSHLLLAVWFFCDTKFSVLKKFITRIIRDTDIYVIESSESLLFVPTHDSLRLVLLPGGFDLTTNGVNPIEFRGKLQSDAVSIMKSIIDCKPVPEKVMLKALKKPSGRRRQHPP